MRGSPSGNKNFNFAKSSCNLASVPTMPGANSLMDLTSSEKITRPISDIRQNNVELFSKRVDVTMETDAIFYTNKKVRSKS
jgi:hypothetical protein